MKKGDPVIVRSAGDNAPMTGTLTTDPFDAIDIITQRKHYGVMVEVDKFGPPSMFFLYNVVEEISK